MPSRESIFRLLKQFDNVFATCVSSCKEQENINDSNRSVFYL